MTSTILSILLPVIGAGAIAVYAYRQLREATWLKEILQWSRRLLSPWTESREEQEKRRIKRSLALLRSLRSQMQAAADQYKNPDLLRQDIINQRGYEIAEYRASFLEVTENLMEIAKEIQNSVEHTVNSLNRDYGKVGNTPETTTTARVETPTPHAQYSTPSADDIFRGMNINENMIYIVRTSAGRTTASGAAIRSEMNRGKRINHDFFIDGPADDISNSQNGYR